ncbi:MAG TPA: methylmalonyl-CoA mutase family protein, partial [Actinomycetota bacterium]|nr:methylmalonyl-CoA mutase family protein [Actinomycetota bacterium]
MSADREHWEKEHEASRKRDVDFETLSGEPLKPLYDPSDVAHIDFDKDIGTPGHFPFTRGIYTSMYRGRLWTIRQFSGFGDVHQTNERYHQLMNAGGTGLSVAFDMPTLMGRDSDDPRSLGEVGHCGVAVDSVRDMDDLFARLPLDQITTSMTISGPAVILFAMYLVAAERQGIAWKDLGGTLQTDIFKEYIAQKEWVFPPEPHLRLIGDLMEFCAAEMPRYYPISVSGYHIREAGSTAAQELAFTLADGFAYVELGRQRGMDPNVLAPKLSFFFDAHIDFFEEIAKFRAARRIWARWMRDRYGVTDVRAQMLKFHTQTAGVSLTAQQPYNNVVRTAIEALAAVLGGTQSLHTNALDETLALPTAEAAEVALRTQQVIAYETGVTNVIDPLGGSYFIEALTDQIEARAEEYFRSIEQLGGDQGILPGVLAGIEQGWFMQEIADAAFRDQLRIEKGRRVIVGVNAFEDTISKDIDILRVSADVERDQHARLADLRSSRDTAAVEATLARLT